MPKLPMAAASVAEQSGSAGAAAARAGIAAPRSGDALLAVDVQHDFLPGGSLAVAGGDSILAPLNACIGCFVARGLPVFASRCWHPADHVSFEAQGGPWPPHCVAGTHGAAFPGTLLLPASGVVVSKGTTSGRDAYSAFDGTDLHHRLQALQVDRLFVGGLATDYCVLASVLDARALGYDVVLLRDAVAAVEVNQGDGQRALERMEAAGAVPVDSAALPP